MPVSTNGYEVLDNPAWGDSRLRDGIVPGVGTKLWVREELWPLFASLIRDYHNTIKHVHVSDGYDYRSIRTGSAWSDHSSGSAVDINGDAEGATGTSPMSWWKSAGRAVKAARLKRRYKVLYWGGAVECGGDYNPGWFDWMHWACRSGTTIADCQQVIRALRIDKNGIRHDKHGNPI